MKRTLMASALLIGGLLAAVPALRADDPKPENDRDFLVKAAACGVAEVKYGELAEKQARSQKVKDYARMLADEHKRANDKLAEQARGLKVAVLAGLEKDKQAVYDRLSKLNGDEFDRAFMQQMVEDHEKAIKLFEAESKTGNHDGLKTFATNTLPSLKKHLEEARSILDGLRK